MSTRLLNQIPFPSACTWACVSTHDVIAKFKPGPFYFRSDLRNTRSRDAAVNVGLAVVRELELLHEWVREQGMEPPRWMATPAERLANGWPPHDS